MFPILRSEKHQTDLRRVRVRGAVGASVVGFGLAALVSATPSQGARMANVKQVVSVRSLVGQPLKDSQPIKAEIGGGGVQILRPFVIEGAKKDAERGRKALALLKFRPDAVFPGWTLAFKPAKAGLLGLTLVEERRIEIYVRGDRSVTGMAHDIAHEMGHAVDVTYNGDESRAKFLELRGLAAKTPWWTCSGCRDLQVGAGDFAETFAAWAAPSFKFYSELGSEPSAEMLVRFGNELPTAVTEQLIEPVLG